MNFFQCCALVLVVVSYTAAEFVCDTDEVPIICDSSDATVEQEKAVVNVSRGNYDIKATIKCKGSATAHVCLGPSKDDDETVGVMIAVDPLGGEENPSMCFSMFYLGGKAEKYKSTCKGNGFRIEQKLVIDRHD